MNTAANAIATILPILLTEALRKVSAAEIARRQIGILARQVEDFRRASTDSERQRASLAAGRLSLRLGLLGAAIVAAISAVIYAPVILLGLSSDDTSAYLVWLSVTAILWLGIRSGKLPRKGPPETYSTLDIALHRVALQSKLVREVSFDLERQIFKSEIQSVPLMDQPVYVCGQARSGTTILLRILDATGDFCSLSYRSMPFVLAPNSWRRMSGQRIVLEAKPRAHLDGIQIDLESPEAFEEVFWKTFCRDESEKGTYRLATPDTRTLEAFSEYRRLVICASRTSDNQGKPGRYLSKNNNNLTRIDSLGKQPGSHMLIVYRNPIATSLSSLRQHQRLLASRPNSSFEIHYMNWLGHHEFGPNHLPFEFAKAAMEPGLSPLDLDYWLDYWTAVHRYLHASENPAIRLLDHDRLRAQPEESLQALFSYLSLPAPEPRHIALISRAAEPALGKLAVRDDLLASALGVHAELRADARNIY